MGGRWQLVSNTWKADTDGWFGRRDRVAHKYLGTCTGAGQTVPLRTAAKLRYKLANATSTTTVTRYSPSSRFWCP